MRRPALLLPLAPLPLLASPLAAGPIHSGTYPAPTAPLSDAALPAGTVLDHVTTADGLTLTGVEATGRADRPVLLVFHGNASAASGTAA